MQAPTCRTALLLFASLTIAMTADIEAAHAESWKVETLGIPINAVNYENTGGVLSIGPVGKGHYRTRANCLGPDGLAYGVNAKHVTRITADGAVEILTNEGGRFAAIDAQGRFYFAQGPKLLRCRRP